MGNQTNLPPAGHVWIAPISPKQCGRRMRQLNNIRPWENRPQRVARRMRAAIAAAFGSLFGR